MHKVLFWLPQVTMIYQIQLRIMSLDPILLLGGMSELPHLSGCDVAGMKRKATKKPSKRLNPDEVRELLSHISNNYFDVSL